MTTIILGSTVFIFFITLITVEKSVWSGKIKVDFQSYFMLSSYLYLIIPSVIVFFENTNKDEDLYFLFDVFLFYTFILIGFVTSKLILPKNNVSIFEDFDKESSNMLYFTSFICVALFLYFIYIVYGSLTMFLFQRYGNYNVDGISSVTSMIPMLINAYVLFYNSNIIKKNKLQNILVIVLTIVFFTLFLLGGNRNIAVMLLFSFLWGRYYQVKFNIFYVFIFLMSGVFIAAIAAVFREYGIVSVLSGTKDVPMDDLIRYALAYNEGEFGTAYRVNNYFYASDFETQKPPLFSYLLSPILNLIPSSIFPERPTTIAVDFTNFYWSKVGAGSGNLEGLGFSPLVEAKANFNYGSTVIFFILPIIANAISTFFNKYSYILYYFLLGAFASTIFNYFRIDFALYVKFGIMTFVFCLIFLGMSRFRLLRFY